MGLVQQAGMGARWASVRIQKHWGNKCMPTGGEELSGFMVPRGAHQDTQSVVVLLGLAHST